MIALILLGFWCDRIETRMGDPSFAVRESATRTYKKFWPLLGLHPTISDNPEIRTRAINALGRPIRSLLAVFDDPNGRVAWSILANRPSDSSCLFALWEMWGERDGDQVRAWLLYLLDLYQLRTITPGHLVEDSGSYYDTTWKETFSWVERCYPSDSRWEVYRYFFRMGLLPYYSWHANYQKSIRDLRSRYKRVVP